MDNEIIFDWNEAGPSKSKLKPVRIHDETLRDGIQCPSVTDPDIDTKAYVVRQLSALGVYSVNVGLPGAGPRAVEDSTTLTRCIVDEGLPIKPTCAARTHPNDIQPIIEISRELGVPIETMAFLGSSPIRMLAESWGEDKLEDLTRTAVRMAVDGGIPVSFVTEDTVRSHPETLERLFSAAVEEGATGLVLCDTVGHSTPEGVTNLVSWTDAFLRDRGVRDRVGIDWHGHDDRGLSLINALCAAEAGADRIHGTLLGVGERVGNTPLDLAMVNLALHGFLEGQNLTALAELCERVADACDVPIPVGYPVFGRDAFRTGTGVHAAAVIKAQAKGDDWLADRIYSGVPAAWFGRKQEIEIGHQSGVSNVKYWLKSRGFDPTDALVQAIFDAAKKQDRLLSEEEVRSIAGEA